MFAERCRRSAHRADRGAARSRRRGAGCACARPSFATCRSRCRRGSARPDSPLASSSDLRPGHVIELDQAVGAPIEIVLNREVVLARGEVVEVGDEYGVRITEIVSDKVV